MDSQASPRKHEDVESTPHTIEVANEQKAELRKYDAGLVWRPSEAVDLNLLDDDRRLVHVGKLLQPSGAGFARFGWSELLVLLFDNYLVVTEPKERDGETKYHVVQRPFPLKALSIANSADPPTQHRSVAGRLSQLVSGSSGNASSDTAEDPRIPMVYPFSVHLAGRHGGPQTLYAESAAARAEWKEKLVEARGLRKVVRGSSRVFEVKTLSTNTFLVPSIVNSAGVSSQNAENTVIGQVTCSVPFTTADERACVVVGCNEGVWAGLRGDSQGMRRVLSVKNVTQCAMLEEFGIFLVLADKSLFAYHIEALVPDSQRLVDAAQTTQKLNGNKEVEFFSVGKIEGRTLVIYAKKKGSDSIFRVLEPVADKINAWAEQPASSDSQFGSLHARSDWFRVYKDFFVPNESHDLIFLKSRVAVLCTQGFEIMDLTDFTSVAMPQLDDAQDEKLAKRCRACRPLGLIHTGEGEFLLCYDEFGLFVNQDGNPIREKPLIEWEGMAERVAWHPPYVLAFDSRFVEVHSVETGHLAQVIPGEDVRATWDGRDMSPAPAFPREDQTWQDVFEAGPRIHGVMRAAPPVQDDTPAGSQNEVSSRRLLATQRVFELVPTNLPSALGHVGSPQLTAATYDDDAQPPPGVRDMCSQRKLVVKGECLYAVLSLEDYGLIDPMYRDS